MGSGFFVGGCDSHFTSPIHLPIINYKISGKQQYPSGTDNTNKIPCIKLRLRTLLIIFNLPFKVRLEQYSDSLICIINSKKLLKPNTQLTISRFQTYFIDRQLVLIIENCASCGSRLSNATENDLHD